MMGLEVGSYNRKNAPKKSLFESQEYITIGEMMFNQSEANALMRYIAYKHVNNNMFTLRSVEGRDYHYKYCKLPENVRDVAGSDFLKHVNWIELEGFRNVGPVTIKNIQAKFYLFGFNVPIKQSK